MIETILALYPESERLQAVSTQDQHERTVLHCALYSNKVECIKAVLSIYPESQRIHALDTALLAGQNGPTTGLDMVHEETRDSVMEWLSK